MSYFTRLGDVEETAFRMQAAPAWTTPEKLTCSLRIYRDGNTGQISYTFVNPTYILWHKDDTITFTIDNWVKDTEVVFHKHICSHGGCLVLIDPANDMPLLPSAEYAKHPKQVTFKFSISGDQMIHIGMIVEIKPNAGGNSEFMLCDPQVGSGPP